MGSARIPSQHWLLVWCTSQSWGTELELLSSGRNADLTEDQVDTLWTEACPASDSPASYVLPSVARGRVVVVEVYVILAFTLM
jgi:hypothetical protein